MRILKPIQLAVIFDQILYAGGGFQQALNAAIETKKIPEELATITFFTHHETNLKILDELGIKAKLFTLNSFDRLERIVRQKISNHKLLQYWKVFFKYSRFESIMLENNIDVVYFLSPTLMFKDLEVTNFISTVWDLCHRDFPEFPEVRVNRTFESREKMYVEMLPKSLAIIVDSVLGKDNVVKRYLVDEERVYILPFSPSISCNIHENVYHENYFDVKKSHNINFSYVFYPAQFWSHKNHIYILEGLKILEDKFNKKVGVIFSGSDKGNLEFVKKTACELNLIERVKFVGFIENNLMPYYYKQSIALVMPTYFGPTNLPPLEAFILDVPVLYPDIKGLKEQVEDAALLIDLDNPESMALSIQTLLEHPEIAKDLIKNGKNIIKKHTNVDHSKILSALLKSFQRKRACWA